MTAVAEKNRTNGATEAITYAERGWKVFASARRYDSSENAYNGLSRAEPRAECIVRPFTPSLGFWSQRRPTPRAWSIKRINQSKMVLHIIKKELRRRSAVEAVIGHLKTDGHIDRNYLKGRDGDHANAVLTATGHNLRLVVKWLRTLLRRILAAIRTTTCANAAFNPAS